MRKLQVNGNTLAMRTIILPVLLLFLSVGDWHIHAEADHPCDTEHSAVQSPLKWHPHSACADDDDRSTHEDFEGSIRSKKFDPSGDTAVPGVNYTTTSNPLHVEVGHDCQAPLILHSCLLHTTVLLI